MPYSGSSQDEIKIVMSFSYLNLFKPNGHKENYHIRKANDESFLYEIEKKTIFMLEIK